LNIALFTRFSRAGLNMEQSVQFKLGFSISAGASTGRLSGWCPLRAKFATMWYRNRYQENK